MKYKIFISIVVICSIYLLSVQDSFASIFKNIEVRNKKNNIEKFSIGVSRTTGQNFIPLSDNNITTSINLYYKGYYAIISDDLYHTGLPLNIQNNTKNVIFKIDLIYDKKAKNFNYSIINGQNYIKIMVDNSETFPLLIINPKTLEKKYYMDLKQKMPGGEIEIIYNNYSRKINYKTTKTIWVNLDQVINKSLIKFVINNYDYECDHIQDDRLIFKSKPFVFYDFNSTESVLKKYYPNILKIIKENNYYSFFYYYKTLDKNQEDSFNVIQKSADIKGNTIGIFYEIRDVDYYLEIINKLFSIFGKDGNFTNKIILISRYGKNISKELNDILDLQYKVEIVFKSYDDLTNIK